MHLHSNTCWLAFPCQDMMAATLASGAFQGSCTFTGAEGPVKGKRMSNAATRAQLQVRGRRGWGAEAGVGPGWVGTWAGGGIP